jgi:nicotinate-nucleotide pyrophosphorylase (carboxylating)
MIADIRHMPASECSVWPAMWLLGQNKATGEPEWPNFGEIDVLEGVNDYQTNAVTLHTSTGCMIDNGTVPAGGSGVAGIFNTPFTGLMTTDDCDIAAPGQGQNVGCSIQAPATLYGTQTGSGVADNNEVIALPSYGTEFNRAGGGIYAMEWTPTSISVWFFPRNSPSFTTHFGAQTAATGTTAPDPSAWGTPMAHFSGSGCDFTERFKDLSIIFNTAFCGEWAGREWDKSCAAKTGVSTCEAYVRDNPEAFKEAYWEVSSLKWFQKGAAETKLKRQMGASDFITAKGRWYAW